MFSPEVCGMIWNGFTKPFPEIGDTGTMRGFLGAFAVVWIILRSPPTAGPFRSG